MWLDKKRLLPCQAFEWTRKKIDWSLGSWWIWDIQNLYFSSKFIHCYKITTLEWQKLCNSNYSFMVQTHQENYLFPLQNLCSFAKADICWFHCTILTKFPPTGCPYSKCPMPSICNFVYYYFFIL